VVTVPLVHVKRASVRYIAVPRGPHTVAVGGAAVWVSTSGGITKLDPATGRLAHFIRIPNDSEWDDLAYGGGAVWYLQAGGVLSRVDPTTLRPVRVSDFGGDRALKGRKPQSWSWVAATAYGACVGRLASGTPKDVLCFDALLRRYWLVDGGPDPLVADARGNVFAGGAVLTEIAVRSRSASILSLLGRPHVTALTVSGSSLWAAVESKGADPRAEIWHIVGRTTVSRTMTDARYIENIAVNDAGVWVLYPTPEHVILAAVEPDGALKRVATLPDDARSLVATAGALWTANSRDSTVARITGYTAPG
jgi:hypothetical protein